MPLATFLKDHSRHPAPVVVHRHANVVVRVRQLDVHMTGARAPEGVTDRFARDAANLVAHERMERPWLTLHDEVEGPVVFVAQLPRGAGQRVSQVLSSD